MRRLQSGFSLVELMISSTLSLLLILSITQYALLSNSTQQLHNTQQELQQAAWAAIHFLSENIRKAGYWGCMTDKTKIHSGLNSNLFLPAQNIAGTDNKGLNNSDTLYLQTAGPVTARLDSSMSDKSSPLQLSNHQLEKDQAIFITNCWQGEIFQLSGYQQGKAMHDAGLLASENSSPDLQYAYTAGSYLHPLQETYYELRTANKLPTLYRRSNGGYTQALLENVEDIQFLYGEDMQGDIQADRYLPIDQITRPEKIRSIEVSITVRSSQPLASATSSADGYIRHTVTTIIPVNNRLTRGLP